MERIYIYGNETSMGWGKSIGNLVSIPSMTPNDFAEIHNFAINSVMGMVSGSVIVIDLDSVDPALSLTIAMHIRLSVLDLKEKAFLPIIVVSSLEMITFLSLGECSQFFLAHAGYAFCTPNQVQSAIKVIQGLTVNNYKSAFLDIIQIRPDDTIGTHSMANQWGADVLNRIISKENVIDTEEIAGEKKKLYYKYVYLNTVPIDEIINNSHNKGLRRNEMCNALQKRILLIDDEANKGWKSVLKKWLFQYSSFDVVDQQISNYDELPEDIKKKISEDFYDLYLLDLRLLGNQEDEIYDTDNFSGMKVLRSIKKINVGNQVIIMTASNKAWNMKSLFDAGADGYYIKESPELKLPKFFSEANYLSFSHDVKTALNCSYKKEVYKKVVSLEQQIRSSTKINGELANEIISAISSAQNQLQRARSENDFAYSHLSLFQIFEMICRDYITSERGCSWMINHVTPLYYYDVNGYTPIRKNLIYDEFPSIKNKMTGIYIDICNEASCNFLRDDLYLDIDRRNAFVHNDTMKLSDSKISKVFRAEGFTHLLNTIEIILQGLL